MDLEYSMPSRTYTVFLWHDDTRKSNKKSCRKSDRTDAIAREQSTESIPSQSGSRLEIHVSCVIGYIRADSCINTWSCDQPPLSLGCLRPCQICRFRACGPTSDTHTVASPSRELLAKHVDDGGAYALHHAFVLYTASFTDVTFSIAVLLPTRALY